MTSTLIGIESVMGESALAITKGYTGTPDQATGYEATYLADESPATEWRTTDTDRDSTRALVRWGRKRYLRTVAGWEHNLGKHAIWRWTADDDWALKPAVLFDGIDDKGVTSETLTGSADVTLIGRFRLLYQPVANNTAPTYLVAVGNSVGSGIRFRLYFQQGDAGSVPWTLVAQVMNWGTAVALVPSVSTTPSGQEIDVAIRYRDSDQRCDMLVDGVQVASVTASAPWPNNGPEKITVGASNAGVQYSRCELIHLEYWGAYLSDSDTRLTEFRAAPRLSTARNLLGAWHVTEGSGATVADVKGSSPMTLTGGAWVERVRHDSRWSTGALEARGQWRTRQALVLGAGVSVTSPVIGSAPRDITLSGLLLVPETGALAAQLGYFGPSFADSEIGLSVSATGLLVARTNRAASTETVSSLAAVNDGVLRWFRVVLNGRDKTLALYIGTPGAAEVLQGTNTSLAAYDAVASCVLVVGGGTLTATRTADWRVYSCVQLEATDPLDQDVGVSNPDMLAKLALAGSVIDDADPARSYTVVSATYDEVAQVAPRALPSADARRTDSGAAVFDREQPLLVAFSASAVEAVEGCLEIWDAHNSDGYVRLAVLVPQDGWQGLHGRGLSLDRRASRRPAKRMADGLVYRERGYDTDSLVLRLPFVRTFGDSADIANTNASEADELLARLRRNPRDSLVTVIGSPWVPQHRLAAHAVVGVVTDEQPITDPHYGLSSTEITIESVRRPPSS